MQDILSFVGADSLHERGGMLGWKDGGLRYFCPDVQSNTDCNTYAPSVEFMNQKCREWAEEGIEFCGIIHSHIAADCRLSEGDRNYILQILQALGGNRLFFPVAAVMEEGIIISFYSAWLQTGELAVAEEQLMFV